MKLYIHRGKGHWVGSVCIVQAEDIDQATSLVLDWLDANELYTEPIDIQEVNPNNLYVYTNKGDH